MSNQDPVYIWKKYFSGNNKVRTRLKDEVKKPKVLIVPKNTTTPSNPKLLKNDPITVHPKPSGESYERQFLVESDNYKGVIFLVSATYIEKPKKGTDAIKPQHFGLEGTNPLTSSFSVSKIEKMVKTKLMELDKKDMPGVVKDYLTFLLEQTIKQTSKTFPQFKTITVGDIKNIAKNFGEILSGVVVITRPDLFKSLNINKDDLVFFPEDETMRLYDFTIVGKERGKLKEKNKFSVKAQISDTKSNTVKPEDIIKLIDKDAKLKRQCSGKELRHQYQITKILAENSVRHGPLLAVIYAKKNNLIPKEDDFKGTTEGTKGAKMLIKQSVKDLEEIIKRDATKKGKDDLYKSHAQIYLEVISRKKLDFTELFLSAIRTKVYYIIVSGLNERGVVWKTIGVKGGLVEKEIKPFDITLRGKHDFNSGRMGFDV
jgi:hypothetical protein